jgi:hypothetical protein
VGTGDVKRSGILGGVLAYLSWDRDDTPPSMITSSLLGGNGRWLAYLAESRNVEDRRVGRRAGSEGLISLLASDGG